MNKIERMELDDRYQWDLAFLKGKRQGIELFAWWKDGTQYVGTCGKTLKEAFKEVDEQEGRIIIDYGADVGELPAILKEYVDKKVTVCGACFRVCCWNGEFMCERAQGASTVQKTIAELVYLRCEHTDYLVRALKHD